MTRLNKASVLLTSMIADNPDVTEVFLLMAEVYYYRAVTIKSLGRHNPAKAEALLAISNFSKPGATLGPQENGHHNWDKTAMNSKKPMFQHATFKIPIEFICYKMRQALTLAI